MTLLASNRIIRIKLLVKQIVLVKSTKTDQRYVSDTSKVRKSVQYTTLRFYALSC